MGENSDISIGKNQHNLKKSTFTEEYIEELRESNRLRRRYKRDFMYASGAGNETDPQCFQQCNDAWKQAFESKFQINSSDFYDFPFHPKILDYAKFVEYCEIADRQTQCFIEKCNDESADRVFSPANFLCHFKRNQFAQARPCLEESEPLTFLKCDQKCHSDAVQALNTKVALKFSDKIMALDEAGIKRSTGDNADLSRAQIGKVFATTELDNYENELNLLCSFQDCYKSCHETIISPEFYNADVALDLVATYVHWHAADVYDWHLVTENTDRLPSSCARLANMQDSLHRNKNEHKDPILKLIQNVS
ncbi:hypothetical protein Ddc_11201 [Ditylenchus destructor]|nr:hypothetical protein Ddc_11201 [Ditylenchus destructor]